MKSALLFELAHLVRNEADHIGGDPCAWPPRPPLDDAQRRERDRLDCTSRAIAYRANVARYEEGPVPS